MQDIEILLYKIPDTRNRDKEFERGRECLLPPEEAGASCFNDLCLSLEKGLT
jgi:hypothetical protein